MGERIVIDLPDDLRVRLREFAQAEGVSENEVIVRVLGQHLFLTHFRRLRAETLAHMRRTGQPGLTDEDMFRIVS